MTREEAVSFIVRRALLTCDDYDKLVEAGDFTSAEVMNGATAAISAELEACLNIARNASTIEGVAKSPAEAVAMLSYGFGHLAYVATLACALAMQMPGLDRVARPAGEVEH